jgi:hypothetical protein
MRNFADAAQFEQNLDNHQIYLCMLEKSLDALDQFLEHLSSDSRQGLQQTSIDPNF